MTTNNLHLTLTKELLEKEYKELKSLNKIAKKHGVSFGSVKHYMRKYDIPYKTLIRYACDDDFFSRDNEESFYIAGFVAADGCLQETGPLKQYRLLQIWLKSKDVGFLEMLKLTMKANHPLGHKDRSLVEGGKVYSSDGLSIVSEKMFNDLARFGITPRKSLTYVFPEWLENHDLVHHFMRGYFDGDGSFKICKSKKRQDKGIRFNLLGTLQSMEVYRDILERNECITGRAVKNRAPTKIGNIFSLDYGGNGVVSKIAQFLYRDATIYLPRKYDRIKHLLVGDYFANSPQSKLTREVLERDYAELKDLHKIAAKHNVSFGSVRNYMIKFNIQYEKQDYATK